MAAAWAFLLPAGELCARDWYRYENDHFVAYSNAPERRTRLLLEELERFRAVFLLVGNVEIPDDAPRTMVILARNQQEFRQFAGRFTGGFALRGDGQTLIVMPATGERDWATTVIRHEFAHALLRYKGYPYPFWYEEGFAEIMSAVSFPDRGRAFTIGAVPQRAGSSRPRYDWNDLIADDFNLHAIGNPEVASSAYAQAWLLAHWATFGDETRNAAKLQQYFNLVQAQVPSLEAFSRSFGATPAELWAGPLQEYSRRVPAFQFGFDTTTLDTGFDRTPADPAEYEPVLEHLRIRHLVRGTRMVREPLSRLSGAWGTVPLVWHDAVSGKHCEQPVMFSVDGDAGLLSTIRHLAADQQQWQLYRIEIPDRESLLLHPESRSDGELGQTLRVQMPERDLLCVLAADGDFCQSVLQRCG